MNSLPSEDGYGLVLASLSVFIRGKPILRDIDLRAPANGVTWIVGPVASGKSTLLRAASGFFVDRPDFVVTGSIRVVAGDRGVLVGQQAGALLATPLDALVQALPRRGELSPSRSRELAEVALLEAGLPHLVDEVRPVAELSLDVRRRLAIARAAASEPSVIFVDEPTAALDESGREATLRFLAKLSLRTCVVAVSHIQRDLAELPGWVHLLAGGHIHEVSPSPRFLAEPSSKAGRDFVRTGGTDVPSLGAPPLHVGQGPVAAPWIKWVIPERLAGVPRPGLLRDLEEELGVLARVGASLLVCLEETVPYAEDLVRAYGMTLRHLPIQDMEAASVGLLRDISREIDEHTARGGVAVVHCKAGLGRTGMVLASVLVRRGRSAEVALREIRVVEPRFVQTEQQEAALVRLATELGATSNLIE